MSHRIGFAVLAVLFAVTCGAQEILNSRTSQIERRIASTKTLLASTTNDADRALWTQRLELLQQDLDNLRKREALEQKEKSLAEEQNRHSEVALREMLQTINTDAAESTRQSQQLARTIQDLRAERSRMEETRQGFLENAQENAERLADMDQRIRNSEEEILARSIERTTVELQVRLCNEALRIDETVRALPVNPHATIRLLVDQKRYLAGEEKQAEDISIGLVAMEQEKANLEAALALSREKLSHVDTEIELLEKQRQVDSSRGESRTLYYMAVTEKKLLALRIQTQQEQITAASGRHAAAVQLRDLYQKEINVLKDNFDALLVRYRKQFIWPVSAIVLLLIIQFVLGRLVLPIFYQRESLFIARRLSNYLHSLLMILVLAIFFLEDIKQIATVLGIASAAVVIALQDLCSAFAGWFVIIGSRKFVVGDRVEIEGMRGDIIDIQLLRTTLVEVNNWLGIDEPTGRIVFIPNNFVFKSKVFNYSHVHPFVWNKVDVTVTYETPTMEAQALLQKVLEEETAAEFGNARQGGTAMENRYGVSETAYQPKIFMVLADSGVTFSLVYCCHYRSNGGTRNRINKRIIEEFAKDPRMQLAYPTHREIRT